MFLACHAPTRTSLAGCPAATVLGTAQHSTLHSSVPSTHSPTHTHTCPSVSTACTHTNSTRVMHHSRTHVHQNAPPLQYSNPPGQPMSVSTRPNPSTPFSPVVTDYIQAISRMHACTSLITPTAVACRPSLAINPGTSTCHHLQHILQTGNVLSCMHASTVVPLKKH